jgi:hypothetical protein
MKFRGRYIRTVEQNSTTLVALTGSDPLHVTVRASTTSSNDILANVAIIIGRASIVSANLQLNSLIRSRCLFDGVNALARDAPLHVTGRASTAICDDIAANVAICTRCASIVVARM